MSRFHLDIRYHVQMINRIPFSDNEWYHCFTRGIDKRSTFKVRRDYERFLHQVHVCNTRRSIHRSDLTKHTTEEILRIELTDPLVAIGSFCLMPNHFHLVLRQRQENGIARFMQKLGTAYSMYFNIKYARSGGLFVSPFRSKHLASDEYFQYALQYVHCNPAELYEPLWKSGKVSSLDVLEKKLLTYPYSSFGAFSNVHHILRPLLDPSVFDVETQDTPQKLLAGALEYYETMSR